MGGRGRAAGSAREPMQRAALPVSRVDGRARSTCSRGRRCSSSPPGSATPGLLAADDRQPGGGVIITDGAEAMVKRRRRTREALGAATSEVRQMEAEWMDVPTALDRRDRCAAGATCCSPIPRPRSARPAACCGRAGGIALAAWDRRREPVDRRAAARARSRATWRARAAPGRRACSRSRRRRRRGAARRRRASPTSASSRVDFTFRRGASTPVGAPAARSHLARRPRSTR